MTLPNRCTLDQAIQHWDTLVDRWGPKHDATSADWIAKFQTMDADMLADVIDKAPGTMWVTWSSVYAWYQHRLDARSRGAE